MKQLQKLFEGSSAIAEDNLGFLEDLYARFQRDPNSVDSSWREKFRSIQSDSQEMRSGQRIPRMAAVDAAEEVEVILRKQAAVDQLIYHYRTRGQQDPVPGRPGLSLKELFGVFGSKRYRQRRTSASCAHCVLFFAFGGTLQ
ncbi:MAG: 2-oxoglutarate dehydrogenase E1 subunit family protein [Methylococcus sp.]